MEMPCVRWPFGLLRMGEKGESKSSQGDANAERWKGLHRCLVC